MKRVLYLARYHPDDNQSLLRRLRRQKTRYLRFKGQSGFMQASLHSWFNVRESTLARLRSNPGRVAANCDYLIVNSKADSSGGGLKTREFEAVADVRGMPKALFISHPEAGFMYTDDVLDRFDIVFKREHFADLDRYQLAPRNRDKIRLCWLDCPIVPASRFSVRRIDPRDFGYREVSSSFRADVCFYGTQSSPQRSEYWRRVLASELAAEGGIQPHDIAPYVAADVAAPEVNAARYVEAVRGARVNLALEGIGEFTHRHWELWALSSFCLSTPSIRELALPGGAREHEHFVCFDDGDDLIDKIRYYADADAERERMSRNGRALFEQIYDFKAYGAFMERTLDASG